MTGPLLSAPRDDGVVHQALLSASVTEFAGTVAPFLRDGARAGDTTILVSVPERIAAVQEALTPAECAAISFEPATRHYARAAHALANFQQLLGGHVAAGQRVRAVGEPPLAALDERQVHDLCLQEAAFNAVCGLPQVSMVCSYDVRAAPPGVIDAVRRSHPRLVEDGVCRPSTGYTDPLALVAEDRHGPPLPQPGGPVRTCPCPHDPAGVRAFLGPIAGDAGLVGPALNDFLTAVNEIVTNAVTHATIDTVRVWRERGHLVCEVRDDGGGLTDLLAGFRQPEAHDTNGRGLWLARLLTDLVEVRTGAEGTTFRLHAAVQAG